MPSSIIKKPAVMAICGYKCLVTKGTILDDCGIELKAMPLPFEQLLANMQQAVRYQKFRVANGFNSLSLEDGLGRFHFQKFRAELAKMMRTFEAAYAVENIGILAEQVVAGAKRSVVNNPVFGAWLTNQIKNERMPERETILSEIHKHVVRSGKSRTGQNQKRKPAPPPSSSMSGCRIPVQAGQNITTKNNSHMPKHNLKSPPAKVEIPSHMIGPNDTKCFDTFEHAFSKTYLCGKAVVEQEQNKHPVLIRHVLPPKQGEITCPEIIEITNALGPAEISSWFSFYGQEEVKFFKGERGRTGLFLHFVTLEDPHGTDGRVAYVQFGSGDTATRYACKKALPKEASLIEQMNELAQRAKKSLPR